MRRIPATARPDWRARVESQGLVFPVTETDDGAELPYWFEEAYYELTMAEVEELEAVTETLHEMCLAAARRMATGEFGNFGLPAGALKAAKASLAADPPSLIGRFDLHWDGTGPAKLLEYNADTPTGLVESSIAQWYWLQDTHPELDQWNSIHERLILAWQGIRPRLADAPVWFAHHEDEITGEEFMTCMYLRDTAEQAGLRAGSITVEAIGYDPARGCFVADGAEPLRTCFKLYPWETMLSEEFGRYVEPDPRGVLSTTWIEPVWKVLLSNKSLLAVLWQMYPEHPNLLPAYLDDPRELTEWVAKPLHGREGDNIRVHAEGIAVEQPGDYGDEGWCYQQWCPLPQFDGNKAVLGSWVIDGKAAGVGIRESDGWVTDYYARFLPHVIAAEAPDAQQRDEWLQDARRTQSEIQDVLPADRTSSRDAPRPSDLPGLRPLASPIPSLAGTQDNVVQDSMRADSPEDGATDATTDDLTDDPTEKDSRK
ncbi:glutathionylspermidine synthase family protein [Gephyromycinifex aptenodytis]|uniref:glutathionylspermidine synthase family protein n=1 Tax=Gephyromycinifex aptenodytis TaxID=2716227 RepID=UPI00144678F6|nr:glutathionylspermidine synthase family protein [Gephyromycinifex aptenodytis]